MEHLIIRPIGKIKNRGGDVGIVLDRHYAPSLTGLDGFSHVQVLWWFSACDNEKSRHSLTVRAPYRHAPAILGTFATRAPMRPNPIALDCAQITDIDHKNASIGLSHLEAFDGTPVLDIKPYTPSLDRVENPIVPAWCSHWPKCWEASGDFDWENEIHAETP